MHALQIYKVMNRVHTGFSCTLTSHTEINFDWVALGLQCPALNAEAPEGIGNAGQVASEKRGDVKVVTSQQILHSTDDEYLNPTNHCPYGMWGVDVVSWIEPGKF